MNDVVRQALDDLQLFAKAKKGEMPQSNFRRTFFALREHVLGRKYPGTLSLEETAAWAIALVRRDFPDFWPRMA
jgi:hypothetical protein